MSLRTVAEGRECKTNVAGREELAIRANPLRFSYLKESSRFKPIVEEVLEKSRYLEAIKVSDNHLCEVLLNSEKPVGLIIYKKELHVATLFEKPLECFELKTFLVLEQSSDHDYEKILLKRVINLAKKSFAKAILADFSEYPKHLNFFENNFKVIRAREDKTFNYQSEGFAYFMLPQKADRIIQSAEKTNKINESLNSKRKRTERTIGEKETDRQPQAKRQKRAGSEEMEKGKKEHNSKRREETQRHARELDSSKSHGSRIESNRSFSRQHHLPMMGTIYFDYIMNGKKQFEGRVCGPACQKMHTGDRLKLFDKKARWGIICEIVSTNVYNSFEEMLVANGVLKMLPQLEEESKHLSEQELLRAGVRIYESFPGSQRVNTYGAVAIGVKFLNKVYQ